MVDDKWKPFNGHKYKKIHEKGHSNIIFSTTPIEKGKEDQNQIKSDFEKPEPVYSRVYFPEPFDASELRYMVEYWIDGKMVKTGGGKVEPGWDTIQLWITEEEINDVIEFKYLDPGEHEILVWIKVPTEVEEMVTTETTLSGEVVSKKSNLQKVKYVSSGKFKYIVP